MKIFFLISLILAPGFSFSQKADYEKLIPGMSTDEFRKVVPSVIPADNFYNGGGSEKMIYENIEGYWKYEFTKDILVSSFFESFEHVDFREVNEGFSFSVKEKFNSFYKNCDRILFDLTKKYGEPTSIRKDDTTGIRFNLSTENHLLISAEWKFEEFSIRFNSRYDGRTPNDRYQNNINAAPEDYGFVVNIEFKGRESESKMHFRLGETAQEMEKRNSKIFKNGTKFFGSYSLEETWNGLEGTRHFCFQNGKLSNLDFNYNYFEHPKEDELTKKRYDDLMSDFRDIKKDLESTFGIPQSGKDEIPDFKKIEERKIIGVDFLKYDWKTKDRMIELSLRYHYGGKGDNHSSLFFDVKITDLDGNYSYCDR